MSGTAHVEVHRDLRERLLAAPLTDAVRIVRESLVESDIYLLLVSSPTLAPGYHGQQELIVEGDRVAFKPWRDT